MSAGDGFMAALSILWFIAVSAFFSHEFADLQNAKKLDLIADCVGHGRTFAECREVFK